VLRNALLVIAGIVLGAAGTILIEKYVAPAAAPKFNTPFQAVLLDTGQVYYGKIEALGSPYPILRDVFYVQSTTDPSTKQVTNVLIRRGKEWHGPEFTVLNARHIAMVEPVGPTSKVAALISEAEEKAK
jgi:hypothetical protein